MENLGFSSCTPSVRARRNARGWDFNDSSEASRRGLPAIIEVTDMGEGEEKKECQEEHPAGTETGWVRMAVCAEAGGAGQDQDVGSFDTAQGARLEALPMERDRPPRVVTPMRSPSRMPQQASRKPGMDRLVVDSLRRDKT